MFQTRLGVSVMRETQRNWSKIWNSIIFSSKKSILGTTFAPGTTETFCWTHSFFASLLQSGAFQFCPGQGQSVVQKFVTGAILASIVNNGILGGFSAGIVSRPKGYPLTISGDLKSDDTTVKDEDDRVRLMLHKPYPNPDHPRTTGQAALQAEGYDMWNFLDWASVADKNMVEAFVATAKGEWSVQEVPNYKDGVFLRMADRVKHRSRYLSDVTDECFYEVVLVNHFLKNSLDKFKSLEYCEQQAKLDVIFPDCNGECIELKEDATQAQLAVYKHLFTTLVGAISYHNPEISAKARAGTDRRTELANLFTRFSRGDFSSTPGVTDLEDLVKATVEKGAKSSVNGATDANVVAQFKRQYFGSISFPPAGDIEFSYISTVHPKKMCGDIKAKFVLLSNKKLVKIVGDNVVQVIDKKDDVKLDPRAKGTEPSINAQIIIKTLSAAFNAAKVMEVEEGGETATNTNEEADGTNLDADGKEIQGLAGIENNKIEHLARVKRFMTMLQSKIGMSIEAAKQTLSFHHYGEYKKTPYFVQACIGLGVAGHVGCQHWVSFRDLQFNKQGMMIGFRMFDPFENRFKLTEEQTEADYRQYAKQNHVPYGLQLCIFPSECFEIGTQDKKFSGFSLSVLTLPAKDAKKADVIKTEVVNNQAGIGFFTVRPSARKEGKPLARTTFTEKYADDLIFWLHTTTVCRVPKILAKVSD